MCVLRTITRPVPCGEKFESPQKISVPKERVQSADLCSSWELQLRTRGPDSPYCLSHSLYLPHTGCISGGWETTFSYSNLLWIMTTVWRNISLNVMVDAITGFSSIQPVKYGVSVNLYIHIHRYLWSFFPTKYPRPSEFRIPLRSVCVCWSTLDSSSLNTYCVIMFITPNNLQR
jgi:hypothetical protein